MNIDYTFFNKWKDVACNLERRFDPFIVFGLSRETDLQTWIPRFSGERIEEIDELRGELKTAFAMPLPSIYVEVVAEIDLNITQIPSSDQIMRYLSYLKNQLRIIHSSFSYSLRYDWIVENQDSLAPTYLRDTFFLNSTSSNTSDAIELYLHQCLDTVNAYQEVEDYIDDLLNPDQPLIVDEEVTANSHRLILMYKTGAFETLYKRYHGQLGPVRFSKLIATILGIEPGKHEGFRPTVGGLIKEILKPNDKRKVQSDDAVNYVNAFLAKLGVMDHL